MSSRSIQTVRTTSTWLLAALAALAQGCPDRQGEVGIRPTERIALTEGSAPTQLLTITVSEELDEAITLSVTATGTAQLGVDYAISGLSQEGQVVIRPLQTAKEIEITAIDDSIKEASETFEISFALVGASENVSLGSMVQIAGAITDNDMVEVSLSPSDAQMVSEAGPRQVEYTVSLSGPADRPITVDVTVSGQAESGTDYTLEGLGDGGTLTFPPDTTSQTFSLTVIDDDLHELAETFDVEIALSGAAPAGVMIGADSSGSGTIADNDDVTVTVEPDSRVMLAEGGEGGTPEMADITVRLSKMSTQPISVSFAATGTAELGTDYTLDGLTDGAIEIPAMSTSATIQIVATDDNVNEAFEQFEITATLDTPPERVTLDATMIAGAIADNDDITASISPTGPLMLTESGSGTPMQVFTVDLSGPTEQMFAIRVAGGGEATRGSDYTLMGLSMTDALDFGTGVESQTFTMMVTDDDLNEPAETFEIDINLPVIMPRGVTLAGGRATGSILDDDDAMVTAVPAGPVVLAEGGAGGLPSQQAVRIELSRASTQMITVGVSVGAGATAEATDYSLTGLGTGQEIVFSPGARSATVTVSVVDDAINELHETLALALAVSGAPRGVQVGTASVAFTINDDDDVTVSFVPSTSVTIAEGGAGGAPASRQFDVTLSGPSEQSVSLGLTPSGLASAADYSLTGLGPNRSLTFAPMSVTGAFTMTVTDDDRNEVHEPFRFDVALSGAPRGVSLLTPTITGTITDNDDVVVSLSPVGPVSLAEGAAGGQPERQQFMLSMTGASDQNVAVTVTSSGSAGAADYRILGLTQNAVAFTPGQTSQLFTFEVINDNINEPTETFFITTALATPLRGVVMANRTSNGTIADNDGIVLTLAPSAPIALAEGGSTGPSTLQYLVTASGSSVQSFSLTVSSTGTATPSTDYTLTGLGAGNVLRFGPAQTTASFGINVVDDSVNEATESFSISVALVGAPAGITLGTSMASGTIVDNDAIQIAIAPTNVTLAEAGGGAVQSYTAVMTGPSAQNIALTVTATGTAHVGGDYVLGTDANNRITFAPGAQTRTFTVDVIDDPINEIHETFTLGLALVGAPGGVTLSTPSLSGTITDDDDITVNVTPSAAVALAEGGAQTQVVTVTASGVSAQPIDLTFLRSGTATTTDLTVTGLDAGGRLSLRAPQTSRTFTLTVTDDNLNEVVETFAFAGSLTGSPRGVTLGTSQVSGTVADDDDITVSLSPVGPATLREGGVGLPSMQQYNVTLSGASTQPLQVSVSFSGAATRGTDYQLTGLTSSSSLSFAPLDTVETFNLLVTDDTVNEAHEGFEVNVALQGSPRGVTVGTGRATGTINDNDDITLSFTPASVALAEGGNASQVYTARLSGASAQTITTTIAISGTAVSGTDYTLTGLNSRSALVFAPGTSTQTFSLAVTNDTVNELSETFAFAGTLSGTPRGVTVVGGNLSGTVADDDDVVLTISPATGRVTEDGSAGTISQTHTISFTGATDTSQSVTMNIAATGGTALVGTDYTLSATSLVFGPGDVTAKSFQITASSDILVEGDETYRVTASRQGTPRGITPASLTVTGTIVDTLFVNDPPTFDTIANATTLEDSGTQSIMITNVGPGGAGEMSQVVTFTATSSDPMLIANPVITGMGATRTLTYTPTSNASGTVTIFVTARDDGGTANGGTDTTRASFTITVTPVNDAPDFTAPGPQTTLEDSAAQSVTIAGLTPGPGTVEASQTITVTAVSSDAAVIPNPTVTGSGATRTLSYTPALNAVGNVTITVTAQDNGGTTSGGVDLRTRTFTIAVTGVNDAPSFDVIAAQTSAVGAGAQTVTITGVNPGGGNDESAQVVMFTAVSSNTAVTANPTVTGAGTTRTLTYTPLAAGMSTITVTGRDGGGTANGGVDSFSRTFVLTVASPPSAPRNLLVAGSHGSSIIQLSWVDTSTGESGFAIERRPSSGGTFARVGVAPASRPVYADTTSTADSGFQYRVRALVGNLESAPTNTASALTTGASIITRVTGNGSSAFAGDNGPAINGRVNRPCGVAYSYANPVGAGAPIGTMFIADRDNHRVRFIGISGEIGTTAGNGTAGFGGDGGPSDQAQLNGPTDVAVDDAGDVLIADTGNNRIRHVSLTTGNIRTIAGDGTAGFGGDVGPAVSAQLNGPEGVAVDGAGNVYIADTMNNRIRLVSALTGAIVTLAGDGVAGFSGDGGLATSARLRRPRGMVIDDQRNLYFADTGNHRIRRVDLDTGRISTVVGDGQGILGNDRVLGLQASLRNPHDVDIDTSGNLYIADTNNHRVRRWDRNTGLVTTFAGTGTAAYAGDGMAASQANLQNPASIALSPAQHLSIADRGNNRVRRVNNLIRPRFVELPLAPAVTGGSYLAVMAAEGGDSESYNWTISTGQLPAGLSLAPQGFYALITNTTNVTTNTNFTVQVTDSSVRTATSAFQIKAGDFNFGTIAGSGTAGFDGDNGDPLTAQLNVPEDVTIDANGNAYIADSANHRLRQINNITGRINTYAGIGVPGFSGEGTSAANAQLREPASVVVDALNNVLFSDRLNHRIRRVDGVTGDITTLVGTGTAGFSGDNNLAFLAQLDQPSGITFDAAGSLYIADSANHRVRRVDVYTGVITTIAGNGTPGFAGDQGQATSAQLNVPSDVHVVLNGAVLVADTFNHRIRLVTPDGFIDSIAGSGATGQGMGGFAGDGGPAIMARFNAPTGIDADIAGNIYLSDRENHRIRRIDSGNGNVATFAGNGAGGFSGDGGPAAVGQINRPGGLLFTPFGLFVADTQNHRIRVVAIP